MTEEDAKKTVHVAGKSFIHVSVKFSKRLVDGFKDLGKAALAKTVGCGLDKYANRTRVFQGKHALKEFIQYDRNSRAPIGQIDVNETDFKDFAKTCKKNGVDFAIVKDSVDENVMHFFFAGKNAEVMSHLFEEYAKNKYQQDLKNEMLPDQEEREHEKAELELDPKDVADKEINPRSKKGQDLKNMANNQKAVEEISDQAKEDVKTMTEKAESLLEESMEDMELPEMER